MGASVLLQFLQFFAGTEDRMWALLNYGYEILGILRRQTLMWPAHASREDVWATIRMLFLLLLH